MKSSTQSQNFSAGYEQYVPWTIFDVFFAYVFIFALSIIFAGIMLYVGLDSNMNFFTVMMQFLLSFSTFMIVYLIITKKYRVSFTESFGISTDKLNYSMGLGIFVTALIILSTTFISVIFSGITGAEPQNPYMGMPEERFKWISFLAVFFAPVVEEIFFRGFMQPAMVKLSGPFFGIVITALVFGVSHTQYLNYTTAIFSVTIIGLILGIVRHRTGSVMPGIFAHFFNNLLAILFMVS